MNPDDASRILARLKAAFPVMTLDDEQAELLLEQCSLLADETILDEAVTWLIQKEERFPPIARIRLAYRSFADARRTATAALARAKDEPVERDVPEWIHVWHWQLRRTRTKRQQMNETSDPIRTEVHQRPPVKMRDFPQYEHPGPDAYSDEEYEKLRQGWIRAGRPTAGSLVEALAGEVGR